MCTKLQGFETSPPSIITLMARLQSKKEKNKLLLTAQVKCRLAVFWHLYMLPCKRFSLQQKTTFGKLPGPHARMHIEMSKYHQPVSSEEQSIFPLFLQNNIPLHLQQRKRLIFFTLNELCLHLARNTDSNRFLSLRAVILG